tara:strand:- start:875 stop:1525 length:651 start_codon:yes stop_codon:yes gene_type:complete
MTQLALDLDEVKELAAAHLVFSLKKFAPMSFFQDDYVKDEPGNLKQRIASKVSQLGGKWDGQKVMFMGQCRCFGFYFSPANFYFCYQNDGECSYMLVEVSNTPWLERHYYLVDLQGDMKTKKDFHVSPFMDLDMHYHWRVKPPAEQVLVHIENHKDHKQFDATLAMKKCEITKRSLFKAWLSAPLMPVKVVIGIYWQAIKLFAKRIPFIAHPESRG